MPATKDEVRYCVFNPNGGQVTVQLQANNALRAAGNFALYADSDDPKEEWGMAAGDSGTAEHTIETSAKSLKGNELAWAIACCSLVPAVDQGVVSIQILQDGAPCSLTKPALWNLTNVPNCSETKKKIRIEGSLIFLSQS